MPGPVIDIRLISPHDTDLLTDATRLNQANVPEVGPVDIDKMTSLVAMSWCSLAAVDPTGHLAAFCIVMEPGAPYTSVNYQWFCDRYRDFVYLDRVAVDDAFRRQGVGRLLYTEVERRAAGRAWLTLEVNIIPPNEPSLEFHRRLGFTEVGQHDTGSYPEYGVEHVRVSLLAKSLS